MFSKGNESTVLKETVNSILDDNIAELLVKLSSNGVGKIGVTSELSLIPQFTTACA